MEENTTADLPQAGPHAIVSSIAKKALRSRIRSARRQRGADAREASAEGFARRSAEVIRLARQATPEGAVPVVLAYCAADTEPDVALAMRSLHDAGVRVAVPRSLPGSRMSWVRWHPDLEMTTGSVAPVPEPVGGEDLELPTHPMVLVLPALAVDAVGVRLGQGGGFYDRFVETLPAGSVLIAAVFEDEVYPTGEVPSDPWDAVADYAWTPQGLRALDS